MANRRGRLEILEAFRKRLWDGYLTPLCRIGPVSIIKESF